MAVIKRGCGNIRISSVDGVCDVITETRRERAKIARLVIHCAIEITVTAPLPPDADGASG